MGIGGIDNYRTLPEEDSLNGLPLSRDNMILMLSFIRVRQALIIKYNLVVKADL